MMFSSDELEILDYLKSFPGAPVPIAEISRCAGGRAKYRENPNWAKGMMARLVDAKLIEVNDRGHYRFVGEVKPAKKKSTKSAAPKVSQQVDDNYFPADTHTVINDMLGEIVGEDYFPTA